MDILDWLANNFGWVVAACYLILSLMGFLYTRNLLAQFYLNVGFFIGAKEYFSIIFTRRDLVFSFIFIPIGVILCILLPDVLAIVVFILRFGIWFFLAECVVPIHIFMTAAPFLVLLVLPLVLSAPLIYASRLGVKRGRRIRDDNPSHQGNVTYFFEDGEPVRLPVILSTSELVFFWDPQEKKTVARKRNSIKLVVSVPDEESPRGKDLRNHREA